MEDKQRALLDLLPALKRDINHQVTMPGDNKYSVKIVSSDTMLLVINFNHNLDKSN